MNRIGRRTILCMTAIALGVIAWSLLRL